MTFQDLIKEFYDNPQDCINPCEKFDCELDCKNCFYNKLVNFSINLYEKFKIPLDK